MKDSKNLKISVHIPYYVSENYISHTDSKKTLIDRIYQLVKGYMLKKKLQHINKYRNGNQLLDIGAGTGDFLVAAKNDGWKVNGIEPSKIARKNAEKKDLTLFELKSNLNNQKFDLKPVIIALKILEFPE